jgi:hypothetical protein
MITPDRFTVLDGGPTPDERDERLTEGADELLADGPNRSLVGREHVMLTIAATVLTLGFSVILIGWAGAANATVVEEQLPYLISGGLLGVALVTFGSFTLFSHWQTVRIREARRQEAARRQDHAELMTALQALAGPPSASSSASNGGRLRAQR